MKVYISQDKGRRTGLGMFSQLDSRIAAAAKHLRYISDMQRSLKGQTGPCIPNIWLIIEL